MTYNVVISEKAKTDLIEIYNYIAYNMLSPINGKNQLQRIKNNIVNLNEMPKRFPLYPHEPWCNKGIRYMVTDNYVVFYIVEDESRTVTVLRVIYSGRDIDKVFESN